MRIRAHTETGCKGRLYLWELEMFFSGGLREESVVYACTECVETYRIKGCPLDHRKLPDDWKERFIAEVRASKTIQ